MDAKSLAELLPPTSLFAACRADELEDLLALSKQLEMKKGQTLLLQGDPGDHLIILLDGHAKMGYKQQYQPLELLHEGRWQRSPAGKDTTE